MPSKMSLDFIFHIFLTLSKGAMQYYVPSGSKPIEITFIYLAVVTFQTTPISRLKQTTALSFIHLRIPLHLHLHRISTN